MSDIDHAKSVISTEIEGLQKLAESIDVSFTKATDAIHNMKSIEQRGRLIIAGMGKSGHIARKIAATMASTGTPAYFVHPGEASHGDLGMITQSRRGADPLQLRRGHRTLRPHPLHQTLRHHIDLHHLKC